MKRAIILLSVFLIIWGCGGGTNKDYIKTDRDFRTGTEGVEISFSPGSPPANVYEETPFEISATVWNKGAYEPGTTLLTLGLESDYMCARDENNGCTEDKNAIKRTVSASDIMGKSVNYPAGGKVVEIFSVRSKQIDRLSNEHTSLVYLTSCYTYNTEAIENICIDPDPLSIKQGDKVCQAQDLSLSSQGAPIAITKIETEMLPYGQDSVRPQFIIHVKNAGTGKTVDKNSGKVAAACGSGTLDRKDWNVIYLEGFGFSDKNYFNKDSDDIVCSPNPIRLSESGEGYFRCTLKESKAISKKDTSAFITQIRARLGYGYTTTISRNVVMGQIKTY